ncbi:MAG: trimethylamine methyltransferase family protein [Dehalococcoidia bacterium]|nr:trimethylamine methyltransferase family protein [Dehalococcoidia bacterium]
MSKPKIQFLSGDEIEALHNASLEVLERTGVKVMSEKALNILREAGAKVDYGKNHAIIPRNLVEEALRKAPRAIKYCARNPKRDFVLNKGEIHFTTGGSPPCIIDWKTGERRTSTNEDLARWTRIADYLNNVHVVWPSVTPSDVPAPMQGLTGLVTVLRNTEKHVEHGALNARDARNNIEIAAAIVGGEEQLKKRSILSGIACPISPLTYDKGITEGAIEYGKAGVPIVIFPMPLAGETAPATLAGTVVVNNAENLGNLVILEFANPGAPVLYGSASSIANLKTGEYSPGSPERGIIHMALAQLVNYYHLPCELCSGNCDCKVPDIQAGFERAMNLTAAMLMGGVDIIDGVGAIDASNAMSPELLVIDNEIIDGIRRLTRGFEVDDDTLALDVIDKVGPGGIFLGEKHTLEHYKKEIWMPEISDKNTFTTWRKMGSKTMDKVAKEKVDEILATHKPEPIPEDVEKEIARILKRAETESK